MVSKPALVVDEYAAVGTDVTACGRCGKIRYVGVVLPSVLIGFALGWLSFGERFGERNPNVTPETFATIQQDASAFNVMNLLGSGRVVAEEGYTVDRSGMSRQWEVNSDRRYDSTASVPLDVEPVERIRKTVCWRNGKRAIYVTFFNGKVVEKWEENPY